MYRGEDGEGGRALLDKGAGREELERQREEVEDEEEAELDASDGGLAAAGDVDEEGDEDDAEAARDDVGNVGERAVVADEGDAALWVHADGRGRGVRGDVVENSRAVMLQLVGAAAGEQERRAGERTSGTWR